MFPVSSDDVPEEGVAESSSPLPTTIPELMGHLSCCRPPSQGNPTFTTLKVLVNEITSTVVSERGEALIRVLYIHTVLVLTYKYSIAHVYIHVHVYYCMARYFRGMYM